MRQRSAKLDQSYAGNELPDGRRRLEAEAEALEEQANALSIMPNRKKAEEVVQTKEEIAAEEVRKRMIQWGRASRARGGGIRIMAHNGHDAKLTTGTCVVRRDSSTRS